jgi:flagellar biosynthesis chaperone FliJ
MNKELTVELFFDFLLDLEDFNEDSSSSKYCKVTDLYLKNYSATITTNEETKKEIEQELKRLGLSCSFVQMLPFDDECSYKTGLVKLLDIGL